MRGIGLVGIAAFFLAAKSVAAEEAPPQAIRALLECPAERTNCIVMSVNLDFDAARLNFIREGIPPSEVGDFTPGYDLFTTYIVLRVSARLNGGDSGDYDLLMPGYMSSLDCDFAYLPVLGAREGGGGAIATDQGVLDIESPYITFGSWNTSGLINADRQSIDYFLAPRWEKYFWGAEPAISESGTAYWRTERACVFLDTGGLFSDVGSENCEGQRLAAPTEAEIATVRENGVFTDEYDLDYLDYLLQRVEGTPLLLYTYGVACT